MKKLLYTYGLVYISFLTACIYPAEYSTDKDKRLNNSAQSRSFTIQIIHDTELIEDNLTTLCNADKVAMQMQSRLLDVTIIVDTTSCLFIDNYIEGPREKGSRNQNGIDYIYDKEIVLCNNAMQVKSIDTVSVHTFKLSKSLLSMLRGTPTTSIDERKQLLDSLILSTSQNGGTVREEDNLIFLSDTLSNSINVIQVFSLDTYFMLQATIRWPDGGLNDQFYTYACDNNGKQYLSQVLLVEKGVTPICKEPIYAKTYYLISEPQIL